MLIPDLETMFVVDSLTCIMMGLVTVLSCIIVVFASRYMQADKDYSRFLLQLNLLALSLIIMMATDHIGLFVLVWCICNGLLIRLMIHKTNWRGAWASGMLTSKTLLFSTICLASGLSILYLSSGENTIIGIVQSTQHHPAWGFVGLCFILVSALAQSAIWPFHKWLLSSLNSPTPVSAMMHAGLINGGGLLLVQFGPLYQQQPILLTVMFIAGVSTAIVATLWKLMQHDNKRMLACSTVAQMGFMLMQCGLGLFSAAVAHLCWHGLFKAYLFLWSGRAAAEKRITSSSLITITNFSLALGCGTLGGFIFSTVTGKNVMLFDTNTILVAIAAIASTQVAITVLSNRPWWYLLPAVIITSIGASLYGASIAFIHYLLPLNTDAPQPLNSFYLIGLGLLAVTWLLSLFRANLININWFNTLWSKYYMRILNASQPHANTVTTHVNHYTYQ